MNRGWRLVEIFNGSASAIVSTVYSDFEFLPWLFNAVPKGFFDEKENRIRYIRWLVEKVGVKSELDLHRSHFLENGGGGLLTKYKYSPLAIIASIQSSEPGQDKLLFLNGKKPQNFHVLLYLCIICHFSLLCSD
jgi:hypothetical protein